MYKKSCITLLCSLFIIPCYGMKRPLSKPSALEESKRSVIPTGIWLPKPDDKYSSPQTIAAGTIHRGPNTRPPMGIVIPIARRPLIQKATSKSKGMLSVTRRENITPEDYRKAEKYKHQKLAEKHENDFFDNIMRQFYVFGEISGYNTHYITFNSQGYPPLRA